jgi:hypothetical protein
MSQIAVEVAEAVQRAAELLSNAAKQISNCDCETLDQHALSKVVNELVAAETSARAIHACLRTLQSKHAGKLIAHASLEVRGRWGEGWVGRKAVQQAGSCRWTAAGTRPATPTCLPAATDPATGQPGEVSFGAQDARRHDRHHVSGRLGWGRRASCLPGGTAATRSGQLKLGSVPHALRFVKKCGLLTCNP